MKNVLIIIMCLEMFGLSLSAQQNIRNFIFGHSLINHAIPINPVPSQETSIPHWIHFLAQDAGNSYAVDGQYGFLPNHMNLPPNAQWGFEFVSGVWDSENVPFSAADFTDILITPANFVQWQDPNMNYPYESFSPVDATNTIINWTVDQEPNLDIYLYENWPDMAAYLNGDFPPNQNEWEAYNEYLNGDFHDWFQAYHESVSDNFPETCVSLIPVGTVISKLLQEAPFNEIPVVDLYEDDAPHGKPTIYFLASLVTYMAMYQSQPSDDFEIDPIIHPTVINNFEIVNKQIWEALLGFNNADGTSKVFCEMLTNNEEVFNQEIKISPNPTNGEVFIKGIDKLTDLSIFNLSLIHI